MKGETKRCFTDKKDETEKKRVSQWPESIVQLNRNIREFNFSNEHRAGLHQGQPGVVEEGVVLSLRGGALVQHDVEAEAEGDEEERVPEEEGSEGLEYLVEHGNVDVVLGQLGMSADESDEGGPTHDNGEGGEGPLGVAGVEEGPVRDVEDNGSEGERGKLQPVLQAEDVPLEGHHHLERLSGQDESCQYGETDDDGSRLES